MIPNKIMLITYPDSMGKNLKELTEVVDEHLSQAIGGIHILPFYPSTGDRGFAPTTYEIVDPAFGDWQDIQKLGEKYYLMFDFMLNHISKQSDFFKDYIEKGNNSEYKELFIDVNEFYPEGRPTDEDIDLIYKRKDKPPFQEVHFADGSTTHVWNTFGDEQIDLDVTKDITKQYINNTFKAFRDHGASIIRLDAFAYAIKKLDTNCFFVEPEVYELLNEVESMAKENNLLILPEIHEHYSIQFKLSERDFYIYDFALPMVVLYTLYSGKTNRLAKWLEMSPMKQFTTLDTHDGIGVVDAKDILSDDELNYTSERLYQVGANVKKIYSSEKYNNLDIYQINSTYYSALGENDLDYFLARAIQIFAPGIPQIYYVGLLAGRNDIELLEATKEGRNINRHYYSKAETELELQRDVVQQIIALCEFRNTSMAFDLEGSIEIATPNDNFIHIKRFNQDKSVSAELSIDFSNKTAHISDNDKIIWQHIS